MANKMVLLFLTLLLFVQLAASVDDAATRVSRNQILLYQALHNFALPDSTVEFGDETKAVQQRFILQIPGQTLNPIEYDPGNAYRDAQLNPNDGRPESNIPPRVQEANHYLADTIPALNPLSGGVTGDSFSRTYRYESTHAKKMLTLGLCSCMLITLI